MGSSLRTDIMGSVKRNQLLSLMDYLSGGLPACLETAAQAAVIPRATEDGRFKAVTLLNISIDDTDELTILIRRPVSERFVMSSPGREDLPLDFTAEDEGYRVKLPPLPPFMSVTVRAV